MKAFIFLSRVVSIIALLVVTAGPAGADPDPKALAAELYEQGNALFAEKNYAEALAKYQQAKAHYSSVQIDVNIAATYFELGFWAEAAQAYEIVLDQEAQITPDLVRHARERFAELTKKVASLRITRAPIGAEVLVDGVVRGVTPLPRALFLAPGSHRIEVAKTGYTRHSEVRTFQAGEHEVAVAAPLQAEGGETGPAPDPDKGVPASDGKPSTKSKTSMDSEGSNKEPRPVAEPRKPITGYLVLGAGLALTLTGAICVGLGYSIGEKAHGDYTEAFDQGRIPPLNETNGYHEQVTKGEGFLVAGSIVGGVGLAVTGVSVWLLLRDGKEAPKTSRPTLLIGPTQDGLAAAIGGQF